MRIEQLEFFAAITQYGSLRPAAQHLRENRQILRYQAEKSIVVYFDETRRSTVSWC